MSLTISEMQRTSWQVSEDHEWHEPQLRDGCIRDASVSERLMLIVSEVSEALEAVRNGEEPVWYDDKGKPEGLGIELADVVIRVGDLCEIEGIDLEECIRIKTEYNRGRPPRHGGKAL